MAHQLLASLTSFLPDQASSPLASSSACRLDTIQQDMERLPQGKRRLAVQLRLDADPRWIWQVLTDYDNLHRFIPNLEHSRVIWRRDARVGVEQIGTQLLCGLRFTARVSLELARSACEASPGRYR